MMPGRSTSSPNDSGVHLNAIACGGLMSMATNILPLTQKQRSWPHLTSSVTAGSVLQIDRIVSRVTTYSYRNADTGSSLVARRAGHTHATTDTTISSAVIAIS